MQSNVLALNAEKNLVETLIEVQDLNVQTRSNAQFLLKSVSLRIKKGAHLALMGDSGSGKSTLAHFLAGHLCKSLVAHSQKASLKGIRIFSIPQDADLYLSSYHSLYFYLCQAFFHRQRWRPLSPWEILRGQRHPIDYGIIRDHLTRFDLGFLCKKTDREMRQMLETHTKNILSGGQMQKFVVMLGVLANPDLLIADEIFTDMDRDSREFIGDYLCENDHTFTLLMISHNIKIIRRFLDAGKLSGVSLMRDKRILESVWTQETIPSWAGAMLQADDAIAQVIAEKKIAPAPQGILFQIDSLSKTFQDRTVINIDENSLALKSGVNYAISGKNGVGKTTLFKTLLKLMSYQGRITYCGFDLKKLPRWEFVRRNQMVFQKTGNSLIESKNLKHYLLSFFDKKLVAQKTMQLHALANYFFEDQSHLILDGGSDASHPQAGLQSPFKRLSVGQQRRFLLLRSLLLVEEGGVLFVDEAMRGLDVFLKLKLIRYLRGSDSNGSMAELALRDEKPPPQLILISHDDDLKQALCDYDITMRMTHEQTSFDITPFNTVRV